MNNIIWTKNELKDIKKIILKSSNLKLNEDGEFVQLFTPQYFSYSYKRRKPLYLLVSDELIDLFYVTNKEKVIEVLNMTSGIKVDFNNRLHFGLITALAKININNPAEIFIIFRQIASLYDHIIYNIATKTVESFYDIGQAKERMKEINNSTEVTTEELLVKQEIEKVLSYTNGVTESELFIPLISKLNSLIKSRLITCMEQIITNNIKKNINIMKRDTQEYKYNLKRKYQKSHLSYLKENSEKIYR